MKVQYKDYLCKRRSCELRDLLRSVLEDPDNTSRPAIALSNLGALLVERGILPLEDVTEAFGLTSYDEVARASSEVGSFEIPPGGAHG